MTRGFYKVAIPDYINKRVSSDKRATILSAQKLTAMIAYGIAAPLFGILGDSLGVTKTFTVIGAITIIGGIGILSAMLRKKVI